jgi:methyltransferase (TIGR00027 family)
MTARWIAAQRASLAIERPSVQAGNADAERRLYEGFSWAFVLRGLRQTGMAARTRFFDDAIVAAITRGVDQIIIVGAGYDGRALRFGGGGVSWIEVDHPATQADKRRRLASLEVSLDHLELVAVDLITDDLDVALSDAGHAVGRPTLFICEGLFAYLPQETGRALCRSLRQRSHPDSVLAANCSTSDQLLGESVFQERSTLRDAVGFTSSTEAPRHRSPAPIDSIRQMRRGQGVNGNL